jgi:hypothetical protein
MSSQVPEAGLGEPVYKVRYAYMTMSRAELRAGHSATLRYRMKPATLSPSLFKNNYSRQHCASDPPFIPWYDMETDNSELQSIQPSIRRQLTADL